MLASSGVAKRGSDTHQQATVAKLYAAHIHDVWRWLRVLGVRAADIEDAAHDVFLSAYRAIDRFEGRSTPKSWLFSITHNLAVDYRRRAYVRREQAESSPDAVDTGASPERGAAVAQAQVILDGILDGLPDEQRTTFLLYELGGHTGAAIAEMMEVPLQTVFSRLRAAREHVERESERLL